MLDLGQWDSGTVGQWDRGTVGQWDSGTVGQWGSGAVGQCGSKPGVSAVARARRAVRAVRPRAQILGSSRSLTNAQVPEQALPAASPATAEPGNAELRLEQPVISKELHDDDAVARGIHRIHR